jgi:D,D-heptose 1,7-bisphosphate phosphatase
LPGTRGGKAVFFDKDGTLVPNLPYNVDIRSIRFSTGAHFCLRLLRDAGYRFFVVSNQSGIARGYFKEDAFLPVAERLRQMFEEAGVSLSGFYYCPHHPEGTVREYSVSCGCRKPAPGLLFQAARDHNIDLSLSWSVGDILDDVEAGRRAGCGTVLIDNGGETEWVVSPCRTPDLLASNLAQAALAIVSASSKATISRMEAI